MTPGEWVEAVVCIFLGVGMLALCIAFLVMILRDR